MLITVVLVSTLMAGVWSLSSIYTRMFETSSSRVTETQLMRSLTQLIADDLVSVLPARMANRRPPRRSEPLDADEESTQSSGAVSFEFLASSRLPHFGLIGSEQTLYVSVLQTAPVTVFSEEILDSAEEPVQRLAAFAPDLRVVAYTFQEPYFNGGVNETRPPAGLLRREVLWEYAERLTQSEDPADTSGVGESVETSDLADHETVGPDADDEEAPQESATLVPEVVGLQFRYFDGQSWNTSWDSFEQQRLPVAVEVTLRLLTAEELKEQERLESGETETTDELTADDSAAVSASPEEIARLYRQLVYLPGGADQKEQAGASGRFSRSPFGP